MAPWQDRSTTPTSHSTSNMAATEHSTRRPRSTRLRELMKVATLSPRLIPRLPPTWSFSERGGRRGGEFQRCHRERVRSLRHKAAYGLNAIHDLTNTPKPHRPRCKLCTM